MYRFSRAIFVEIKDLVDPHPETVSVPEGKRRVLQSCEATIERLARDPHYFAKPSQSLFQEIRHLFSISSQANWFALNPSIRSSRPWTGRNAIEA